MHSFMLAPAVFAMRWPDLMMSMVEPTPRRQRENERMVSEKVNAVQEGVMAAGQTMMALSAEAMLSWWSPATAQRLMQAPALVAEAALMPAARSVSANAKRLSRQRPL
mgnify:CR=1 FL=1